MLKDLLPKKEESQETSDYSFSTGSVADYTKLVKEISQEKQYYSQSVDDEPEELESQIEENNSQSVKRVTKAVNTTAAKFVVNSSDRVISFLGNLILGDVDDADFSADAAEKKELQEAWADVFPENTKIPPWLIAVVCTLLIYGPKFQMAIKYKRAQEKIENDARVIHEQKKQLDDYKKELEQIKKTNGSN